MQITKPPTVRHITHQVLSNMKCQIYMSSIMACQHCLDTRQFACCSRYSCDSGSHSIATCSTSVLLSAAHMYCCLLVCNTCVLQVVGLELPAVQLYCSVSHTCTAACWCNTCPAGGRPGATCSTFVLLSVTHMYCCLVVCNTCPAGGRPGWFHSFQHDVDAPRLGLARHAD
jgi:hypothetical protein